MNQFLEIVYRHFGRLIFGQHIFRVHVFGLDHNRGVLDTGVGGLDFLLNLFHRFLQVALKVLTIRLDLRLRICNLFLTNLHVLLYGGNLYCVYRLQTIRIRKIDQSDQGVDLLLFDQNVWQFGFHLIQ